MNFSKIIQQKNKFLLPFSWLYKAGVVMYHKMYDWNFLHSFEPDLPVICVGNLSVGGTGKTPMVEYLLNILSKKFHTAVISRGYKRSTKGIFIADENTTTKEIGDEPMQFHIKFPNVKIIVGEKRVEALKTLLKTHPETELVMLDDAFQHRAINAGFNILLTDFNNIFTDDNYLPAGQLRDLKINYKKADVIIVTKCPPQFSQAEAKNILKKINPNVNQFVFFTNIFYDHPHHIFNHESIRINDLKEAVLVTGIANPASLENYLKQNNIHVQLKNYSDHYRFTKNDIQEIKQIFFNLNENQKAIITTEKDAMRLQEFKNDLKDVSIFSIPMAHHFLFDAGLQFDNLVEQFIQKKLKNGKKEQNDAEKNFRFAKKNQQ
jgi:tetraacyldisaccharide 4'-kinase